MYGMSNRLEVETTVKFIYADVCSNLNGYCSFSIKLNCLNRVGFERALISG